MNVFFTHKADICVQSSIPTQTLYPPGNQNISKLSTLTLVNWIKTLLEEADKYDLHGFRWQCYSSGKWHWRRLIGPGTPDINGWGSDNDNPHLLQSALRETGFPNEFRKHKKWRTREILNINQLCLSSSEIKGPSIYGLNAPLCMELYVISKIMQTVYGCIRWQSDKLFNQLESDASVSSYCLPRGDWMCWNDEHLQRTFTDQVTSAIFGSATILNVYNTEQTYLEVGWSVCFHQNVFSQRYCKSVFKALSIILSNMLKYSAFKKRSQ